MSESSTQQFSGIFVSYRRDDSPGHAGRLFDKLVTHFGKDRIFMDIDTIEPGEDFVTVIENAVGSCEILIAIIGRHWLSSTGAASARLDNPKDFVRLEIGAALARDIRVIPLLVQGATMPKPQDLSDDLSSLSRRHALELSDLRWQRDVDQLIVALERILAQREAARRRATQEEAEWQRQEIETRNKEEAQRLTVETLHGEEAETKLRKGAEGQRCEADNKGAPRHPEEDANQERASLSSQVPHLPRPTRPTTLRSSQAVTLPPAIKPLAPPYASKRALMITAGVMASVAAVAIGVWLGRGPSSTPTSPNLSNVTNSKGTPAASPSSTTTNVNGNASTNIQTVSQTNENSANENAGKKPPRIKPPGPTKSPQDNGVAQREKRALEELNRP